MLHLVSQLSLGGADRELNFGGLNCFSHVNKFLALLFAIGSIAFWGAMALVAPLDPPLRHL